MSVEPVIGSKLGGSFFRRPVSIPVPIDYTPSPHVSPNVPGAFQQNIHFQDLLVDAAHSLLAVACSALDAAAFTLHTNSDDTSKLLCGYIKTTIGTNFA